MLVPSLAMVLASPVHGQVAVESPPLAQWGQSVWETARRGDSAELDRLLRSVPAEVVSSDTGSRFQTALDLHNTNRSQAEAAQDESRDQTLQELRDHMDQDELVEALRSAIQFQDLSGEFDDALREPDVQRLTMWARDRIPQAESEGDWLLAQELLFLLRTLYEDTGEFPAYKRYDKHLDAVNRRLSLLARYAPRRLHALRAQAAERAGEDPIEAFNPANAVDWRERIDGTDHKMLKSALKLAAREHIEIEGDQGWRVLLEGGLNALRILATTPGMVDGWIRSLDAQLDALGRGEEVDSWVLRRVIDEVIEANARTVSLPNEVLFREFGDGAVYKLDEMYDDPYSEVIWPDKLRRFQQATEGNFVGVGILIRHDEKRQIMVVNALEGTPAYFAGVRPSDLIIEVDGESAVGWSLNDAVDRITGPRGEIVTLGLRREGHEDLIQIDVERDVIKLRSVKGWWKRDLSEDGDPDWNWYIDPLSRIAYVRLTQFTENTYFDLLQAWDEIARDGQPNGIILDLRYNPGGLLTSAVQISNLFVQRGLIVSGEDKYGRKAFPDQRADPRRAAFFGVPTVVLINKGSASASEIVAGCLQAHGAAVVVASGPAPRSGASTRTSRCGCPRLRCGSRSSFARRRTSSRTTSRGGRIPTRRNAATSTSS
jgi:C-terminal peptidase prc